MGDHSDLLKENTEITKRIETSTATIVDLFQTSTKTIRFLWWCGKALRAVAVWATPIIAFCAAVWAVANGHWPKGD